MLLLDYLPPRWPNRYLGLDSRPDLGRSTHKRLVDPVALRNKRRWAAAHCMRWTTTAATPPFQPYPIREGRSQRREAATDFTIATALRRSLFTDTRVPDDMAGSSTSTTTSDGQASNLSLFLSLQVFIVIPCFTQQQRNVPARSTGYDPPFLTAACGDVQQHTFHSSTLGSLRRAVRASFTSTPNSISLQNSIQPCHAKKEVKRESTRRVRKPAECGRTPTPSAWSQAHS
jgi:hypothetical protein